MSFSPSVASQQEWSGRFCNEKKNKVCRMKTGTLDEDDDDDDSVDDDDGEALLARTWIVTAGG